MADSILAAYPRILYAYSVLRALQQLLDLNSGHVLRTDQCPFQIQDPKRAQYGRSLFLYPDRAQKSTPAKYSRDGCYQWSRSLE